MYVPVFIAGVQWLRQVFLTPGASKNNGTPLTKISDFKNITFI
jgi:hypothetical protein